MKWALKIVKYWEFVISFVVLGFACYGSYTMNTAYNFLEKAKVQYVETHRILHPGCKKITIEDVRNCQHRILNRLRLKRNRDYFNNNQKSIEI